MNEKPWKSKENVCKMKKKLNIGIRIRRKTFKKLRENAFEQGKERAWKKEKYKARIEERWKVNKWRKM